MKILPAQGRHEHAKEFLKMNEVLLLLGMSGSDNECQRRENYRPETEKPEVEHSRASHERPGHRSLDLSGSQPKDIKKTLLVGAAQAE